MERPAIRTLLSLLAALATLAAAPPALEAQSFGDLLRLLQRGGGWVGIPVENGEGSVQLGALPTAGLEVEGCARVWSGHSGTWTIVAEDLRKDQILKAAMRPGETFRFRHATGSRTELRVDVRWSEPRDTTFHVWVGVRPAGRSDPGEICDPK